MKSRRRGPLLFRCALVAQISAVAAAMFVAACSDDASPSPKKGTTGAARETPPKECNVQAPTSCPNPAPTYKDVTPIFQSRCVVCHTGEGDSPWALTDYDHVSSWGDSIRSELLDCTMPPADAGFELPAEEREAILSWIRCNMPE
jgi:hypothetical protein